MVNLTTKQYAYVFKKTVEENVTKKLCPMLAYVCMSNENMIAKNPNHHLSRGVATL